MPEYSSCKTLVQPILNMPAFGDWSLPWALLKFSLKECLGAVDLFVSCIDVMVAGQVFFSIERLQDNSLHWLLVSDHIWLCMIYAN